MSHSTENPCPTHSRPCARLRQRPPQRPHQPPRPHRYAACRWLDRSLASRCDESWRLLLRRFGPRIRQIIFLMAGEHGLSAGPSEVEELSQELYLYWLRRGTRFEGRTARQFWRFVTISVRHLVIDEVRRVTADKRSPACDPWLQPLPVDEVESGHRGPGPSLATACGRTPEAQMLRSEETGWMWERFRGHCLEVVGEEYIDVLARAVLDGHTSRELSHALGRAGRPVCRSTIDSWVHRLRQRLEAEGLRLPRREREVESTWAPRVGSSDAVGAALEVPTSR